MSHFTQDPKKLQLLADYHAASQVDSVAVEDTDDYLTTPLSCTLQKKVGDMEIYSEVFTGTYNRLPKVGRSFHLSITRENHEFFSWFRTSLVTKVEDTPEGYLIHTLNSVYELKRV